MRERGLSALAAAAVALGLLALVLALLAAGVLGPDAAGRGSAPGAIKLSHGVPVGVQDTPAGALAATDNYLALASQSVEQDPAVFAALVAQVYAPAVRNRTLAQAQKLRGADTQNMTNYRRGGHGIAVIAARRLDTYTPMAATVTSWLAGFVWGPALPPRQSWNLVDTTLRWQAGRWLVVSSDTDPTPAPVPSVVYVSAANDQSPAFGRLAGMTAPFYGTGG
ncbi:MAG: hypothetical protein ABSG95_12600 [Solirubrobacteraceae bacterium]|jgi:hypothetical protein